MTEPERRTATGPDRRTFVRAETMYRIHEVSRLISTYFDQEVAAHDITRAQWSAIMHVAQHPGSTQSELAEFMQMGRAAMGKMLERLEQKNWIERRPDLNDSRVRRAYINEAAEVHLNVMPDAARHLYDAFYKDMSDEQVETLHAALEHMQENARLALKKGDKP